MSSTSEANWENGAITNRSIFELMLLHVEAKRRFTTETHISSMIINIKNPILFLVNSMTPKCKS